MGAGGAAAFADDLAAFQVVDPAGLEAVRRVARSLSFFESLLTISQSNSTLSRMSRALFLPVLMT